jgi:hypothetical protein
MNQHYVVLHHSATVDGRLNDWKGICRFHTSWRRMDRGEIIQPAEVAGLVKLGVRVIAPWRGPCGYHRGIERIAGKVVRHEGRPLWDVGAHCDGFNHRSAGICVVGCFDKEPPDSAIWQAALIETRRVIAERKLDLVEMVERKLVIGHRESYTLLGKPVEKSCPGAKFDMNKFRFDLLQA